MQALANLFKKGEKFHYLKDDIIENPRIKGNVYLIQEGFIKVFEEVGGSDKILIILEPGNVFPVTKSNSSNKKACFEALTNVTLLALEEKIFLEKAYDNNEILRNIIELFTNYLVIYVERLENFGRMNVKKKLIARLIHLEHRFGEDAGQGKVIKIPISHEFLAETINVARENVSREISKLQKEKIISHKNGELLILDPQKLHEKL